MGNLMLACQSAGNSAILLLLIKVFFFTKVAKIIEFDNFSVQT
jgi:hypothetical protein